jgi:hypothetical protein
MDGSQNLADFLRAVSLPSSEIGLITAKIFFRPRRNLVIPALLLAVVLCRGARGHVFIADKIINMNI